MSLFIRSNIKNSSGVYQYINPENTGWNQLSFQTRIMKKCKRWVHNTTDTNHECIFHSWISKYPSILLVTAEMNKKTINTKNKI